MIEKICIRKKIYKGAGCVAKGFSAYRRKLDSLGRRYMQKKPEKIWRWIQKNPFHILIHKDLRTIVGIRTKRTDKLPWTKRKFFYNYVSVSCSPDVIPLYASAEQITVAANKVLDLFSREVDAMYLSTDNSPAMPLFLFAHSGYNNYYAWSLQERKYVEVSDYKSYRQVFRVRDVFSDTSPTSSEGRYVIIPPSDELIKAMGLPIDSAIFSKKCPWDEWVPRMPIEGQYDIIPETFRSRYAVCIETLNRSYAEDLGHELEFYRLEERVHRLERLCQLNAPEKCISDEIALIERVLPVLEKLQ